MFFINTSNKCYWSNVLLYHNDYEVQPTPSVREIISETQRQPLDQHLQKKYNGEYSIHVVQDVLQYRPLLEVYVFESLGTHINTHAHFAWLKLKLIIIIIKYVWLFIFSGKFAVFSLQNIGTKHSKWMLN